VFTTHTEPLGHWLLDVQVELKVTFAQAVPPSAVWTQQQLPQVWQPVQPLDGLSHMWIGTHWLPLWV
jgi:hypothetical protein